MGRVISTYLMDGAPRQLNMSDRDRKAVLHALSYTTHPSALRIAFGTVDSSLRLQNHPNFVRWSVCNGNPERISFSRALGLSGLLLTILIALLTTLSRAHRGWRAFTLIGWVLGIAAIIASYTGGMCLCMHTFSRHHRHVRPWELYADGDEEEDHDRHRKSSFDSFATGSNSFEQEPWVSRYADRSLLRKIFEKEAWIQEPALRQIHDTIFAQAMLLGLLSGGVLTGIFVALPAGNFF